MAATRYTIDVNGNKEVIQTYNAFGGDGAKGDTLRFKLPKGAKVELFDNQANTAPKAFKVRKVGEDLHLAFQGSDIAKPDVVIEGYFPKGGEAAQLVGRGAKGEYFAYTVSNADNAVLAPSLGKTAVSPWGAVTTPVEPVVAVERAVPPPVGPGTPAAAAAESAFKLSTLGWVLGGVGVAAAAGGGGGGGSDTARTSAVSSITPSGETTEGGTLTFAVALIATPTAATVLPFALSGLDATEIASVAFTNGVTYNSARNEITIPAGVSTFSVAVSTVNDTVIENPEAVIVGIDGTAGQGVVNDNDLQSVTTVLAASAQEGQSLNFTVTLNAVSPRTETYALSLTGGTATAGTDYSNVTFSNGVTFDSGTGKVSIPAGVTSFIVTVPTLDDADVDPNETVKLTVGGKTDTGTIADTDSQFVASVTPTTLTASEGSPLAYTVTLSGTSNKVELHEFTLGGTGAGFAVAADYGAPTFSNGVTLVAGKVSIPVGVKTFTVTVPTVNDTADENNEALPLTIGGVAVAGTIEDNDSPPTVSLSPSPTVAENISGGNATYTVSLSAASGKDITVNYATANGSAIAGEDYTAGTGTVTILAGQTSANFQVPIGDDTLDEPNETFTVTISNPTNATLGATTSAGTTIIDNDDPPTVNFSPAANSSVEANGTITYNVVLSAVSSQDVVVNYTTANGTATAGSDYIAKTGSMTIGAGQTSATFTVATLDDGTDEPNETFTVTLTAANGATLGANKVATTTITDNDDAPTIGTVSAETGVEGASIVHDVTSRWQL